MNVIEKFISIEGEGLFQGYPTVFIRFSGCNLNCSYCDTYYSHEFNQGIKTKHNEIIEYVLSTKIKRVTLTGGEPLLQSNINELINNLDKYGIIVNIETNGSIDISHINKNKNTVITMDYKLPSSGMTVFMREENINILKNSDVLKFVCSNKNDLDIALNIIKIYNPKCNIIFSPVFEKINPVDIVNFLIDNKLNNCKLQLQIHKIIWNPNMRCV